MSGREASVFPGIKPLGFSLGATSPSDETSPSGGRATFSDLLPDFQVLVTPSASKEIIVKISLEVQMEVYNRGKARCS